MAHGNAEKVKREEFFPRNGVSFQVSTLFI
jgi:hypothetical protein